MSRAGSELHHDGSHTVDERNDAARSAFADESHAWLRSTVERHGWAVVYVGEDGDFEPGFAYTVGLTSHRLPELFVWGLPKPLAGHVLNGVATFFRQLEQAEAGDIEGVWEGRTLRARYIFPEEFFERASFARSWCANEGITTPMAMQVLWSAADGAFPD